MSEEKALVPEPEEVVPARLYQVVTTLEEMGEIFQAHRRLLKELMVPGTDFGPIPGTTSDRTLFKPGAEKLLILHGYGFEMHEVERIEEWETPFFHYRYRCEIYDRRTGSVVGWAYGSCNSAESKYAYRWVTKSKVPPDLDKESLPRRKNRRGWWVYRIPNPDICDLVNTIDKMAQKRAFVGAVRITTGASGLFAEEGVPVGDKEEGKPSPAGEPVEVAGEEEEEEKVEALSKLELKCKVLYNKVNAILQEEGLKAYYRSSVQVENTIKKEGGLTVKAILATSDQSLVNLLVKHAREKMGSQRDL